jgi:Domain of unknown function (DUF4288)
MWYTASLFIKGIHSPTGSLGPLWKESIRLIEAASEDEARAKAQQIGLTEEHSYQTDDGSMTWVFHCVERVYPLEVDAFQSGKELFTRFLRDSEAISLLTPFEDE